jgi:hypothetical protein
MRGVKTVVHARGEPQRHVAAVAVEIDRVLLAQQIRDRVSRSLDLQEARAIQGTGRADDCVAWAHQDLGAAIDRSRAFPELPDEAIVHAAKPGLLGIAQIEIGKEAPDADRQIAEQRLLDPAEPAYEARGQPARNPVGEQKIDAVLFEGTQQAGSQRHASVNFRR